MTVAALPSTVTYAEDGVSTVFPVPYRFKSPNDLIVERIADGVEQLLAIGIDYTVVGGVTDAGGTVTRTVATNGAMLRIGRKTQRAQPMVYTTGDRFPATSHEEALDRQMLVAQEQDAAIDDTRGRALLAPPGETLPDLPTRAARAGRVALYDLDGAPTAAFSYDELARAILNAAAADSNQGLASAVLYLAGGVGAQPRSVQSRLREQSVSLADFGYVADNLTDNRDVWRRAIQAAVAGNIRVIEVPAGVGRTSQIIGPDFAMPAGLTFRGVCRNFADPLQTGSRVRFTGADACFSISYPTGGPARIGHWAFEDLAFDVTQAGASMFSLNDPLTHSPTDSGAYRFLVHMRFDRCYGQGGGGGDFLRAAKLFHLIVTPSCEFFGWRRAFWLKGCDNNFISGRMFGCTRFVMIERSGFFGNNNVADCRYFGDTPEVNPEPAYKVWDSGYKTVLTSGALLEQPTTNAGCRAHLYIDGYGGRFVSPYWSGAPLFELGPNARENVIEHPTCTVQTAAAIVQPSSTDYGFSQDDRRIRITHAAKNAQLSIGVHPRIVYESPARAALGHLSADREMVATMERRQPRNHLLDASNWWAISAGQVGGGEITFVPDSLTSSGYAVRASRDIPGSGFAALLRIGLDIAKIVHEFRWRARYAAMLSQGEWLLVLLKNGALNAVLPQPASINYEVMRTVFDFRSWNDGDVARIVLYPNGNPDQSLDIDWIEVRPIADPGWIAGSGAAQRGPYTAYAGGAAPAAYDQAVMQGAMDGARDTAARVLALEFAMRAMGGIN